MLETKEQKQVFFGSIALIAVLAGVTYWQRVSFKYQDNTDYLALQKQSQVQADAEKAYLASLNVDPAASQQMLKELLPDKVVKQKVSDALNAQQNIVMPVIKNSDVNITNESG